MKIEDTQDGHGSWINTTSNGSKACLEHAQRVARKLDGPIHDSGDQTISENINTGYLIENNPRSDKAVAMADGDSSGSQPISKPSKRILHYIEPLQQKERTWWERAIAKPGQLFYIGMLQL
jgi:hypothetical protein